MGAKGHPSLSLMPLGTPCPPILSLPPHPLPTQDQPHVPTLVSGGQPGGPHCCSLDPLLREKDSVSAM